LHQRCNPGEGESPRVQLAPCLRIEPLTPPLPAKGGERERSSGALEGEEPRQQKSGLEARYHQPTHYPYSTPGRSEAPPGQRKRSYRYFFFAFLAFFAFFAFFAFLAIVSSQGLMVKRDTRDARRRASLATSSTLNSADSRRAAPHCHVTVITLSTADAHFRVILVHESA